MDPYSALAAFALAAGLLTLTPGLDTALVLRTVAVEGPRQAARAGAGVALGVLIWGVAAALGLGVLLSLSQIAYSLLQAAGAAYLMWMGLGLLRDAWRPPARGAVTDAPSPADARRGWFRRGLASNLLNPKVGAFYVGFQPQFIPPGVDVVGFAVLLAALHAAMGLVWFALLILATRPLARALARPAVTRALDGLTGGVLIGFGLRLAFERRPA